MSSGKHTPSLKPNAVIYNIDGDQRRFTDEASLNENVRKFYAQSGIRVQHIRRIRRVYGVFETIRGIRFIYHPAPKNGTTSIKFLLARMAGLQNTYVDYDDIPIHQQRRLGCEHVQFEDQGVSRTIVVGFPHLPIHDYIASKKFIPCTPCTVRFCIIRDPVERFISLHKNRVMFHREVAPISFDEFIEQLEEFQTQNSDFNTQHYFLGDDPAYYTHIFPLHAINRVTALLSDISGVKLTIPHMQKAPDSNTRPRLTQAQRRKIEKLFSKDYDIFGRFL